MKKKKSNYIDENIPIESQDESDITNKKGTLYLTATPIGNLDDISFRALNTLKSVDVVAAEDTRRTRKLLSYFDIHVPVVSFREHNKVYQGKKLVERLKAGENIALCSDAGMPVISDPGEDFVRLCIEEDIPLTVVPGPNAAVSALVMSGFSANTFLYLGFIPRKRSKRTAFLQSALQEPHTLIFYESPNRIVDLLECIKETMGNRRIFVAREITKIFEESYRGSVDQVLSRFQDRELKGEFTIVLEGCTEDAESQKKDYLSPEKIVSLTKDFTSEGMTRNQAFKKIASMFHISKRAVYQIYLENTHKDQADEEHDEE